MQATFVFIVVTLTLASARSLSRNSEHGKEKKYDATAQYNKGEVNDHREEAKNIESKIERMNKQIIADDAEDREEKDAVGSTSSGAASEVAAVQIINEVPREDGAEYEARDRVINAAVQVIDGQPTLGEGFDEDKREEIEDGDHSGGAGVEAEVGQKTKSISQGEGNEPRASFESDVALDRKPRYAQIDEALGKKDARNKAYTALLAAVSNPRGETSSLPLEANNKANPLQAEDIFDTSEVDDVGETGWGGNALEADSKLGENKSTEADPREVYDSEYEADVEGDGKTDRASEDDFLVDGQLGNFGDDDDDHTVKSDAGDMSFRKSATQV